MLKHLLGVRDSALFKQDYIAQFVEPYIDTTGKPRLIEPPRTELKIIQKKIKTMLGKIEVPDNIFSGIKGRSYADNAVFHAGEHLRYLFKIDLTAFFPSIKRETVYRFFHEDLLCSSDVAQILTNFTTIEISKSKVRDIDAIHQFLENKNVKSYNHLISGAPTSQILSYLANHMMFDEMQAISNENAIIMTVYVDDVTFSSDFYISKRFKEKMYGIIKKYGYQVSKKKVKSYSKVYPKLVTGVIIDAEGHLTIKNSLRKKIIIEHEYLREHPDDNISRQRLRGLLSAARQINKKVYPTIHRFAFDKSHRFRNSLS
jgi:Reverse transcriptase (RNA-dependent DNA polymerase).